jgi:S-formylglutathione hydrolase
MNGHWFRVDIAGKPADVFEPPYLESPRFGVLHLHGHGLATLRDKPVFSRWLEELKLPCVCPHGQRSWWGDRLCREFDAVITPETYLIESVLPFFQQRWGVTPPAIGLQGISMGGQGAIRLAFKRPQLFPVVAGISSALDYHELYGQGLPIDDMYTSKEQCRQDTALMHVPPTNYPSSIFFCIDPADGKWFRGNDRLHEKLNALGIPHDIDFTTRAGGHSWNYFNHMAKRVEQFIWDGLVQQSRRLL